MWWFCVVSFLSIGFFHFSRYKEKKKEKVDDAAKIAKNNKKEALDYFKFQEEKKKEKNYREEQSNKIYKVRIRDTEIYECIL